MTLEDVVFVHTWRDNTYGFMDHWRGRLVEVVLFRRVVLTLGARVAVPDPNAGRQR